MTTSFIILIKFVVILASYILYSALNKVPDTSENILYMMFISLIIALFY